MSRALPLDASLGSLMEGDTIYLTSKDNENMFLYGDPCTDQAEFKESETKDQLPENFEYCLWTVVPAQQYQQVKQLRRLRKQNQKAEKKQKKRAAAERAGKPQLPQSNSSSRMDKATAAPQATAVRDEAFLQRRVDLEAEGNRARVEAVCYGGAGDPVTYGRALQFVHVMSGKYLTGSEHPSKQQKNARSLYINEKESTKSYFRIQPSIKVRSEGNRVYFDDFVDLASVKYAGFSVDVADWAGGGGRTHEFKLTDAVLDSEATPLKLSLYSRSDANSSLYVQAREPVQLFQHEQAAVFGAKDRGAKVRAPTGLADAAAAATGGGGAPAVGPRERWRAAAAAVAAGGGAGPAVGAAGTAAGPAGAALQPALLSVPGGDIEDPANFRGAATWVFEFPQMKNGGSLGWDSPVQLRHLPSGRYLAALYPAREFMKNSEENTSLELTLQAKDLSNPEAPALNFQLEPVDEDGHGSSCVPLGCNVLLKHFLKLRKGGNTCLYLHSAKGDSVPERSAEQGPRLCSERRTQDAFQLVSVPAENARMMERLVNYSSAAQNYVGNRLYHVLTTKANFEDTEKMLTQLIFDLVVGEHTAGPGGDDPLKLEGPVLEFPQRFAREAGLVAALVEMAWAPMKDNELGKATRDSHDAEKPFSTVQRLVFQAICLTFLDNTQNQEYFVKSKTKDGTSFKQVLLKQIPYGCGATECLNSLIEKNFQLMDDLVTEDSMKEFIGLIKDFGPRPDLMEYFEHVCACQSQPILENQHQLLSQLILDEENSKECLLQFHCTAHYTKSDPNLHEWPSDLAKTIESWLAEKNDETFLAKDELKDGLLQIYVSWDAPATGEPWNTKSKKFFHGPGDLGIDDAHPVGETMWIRLEDIFKDDQDNVDLSDNGSVSRKSSLDDEPEEHKKRRKTLGDYLIAQVQMYAAVCYGRHYNAIEVLERMFPYCMVLSLSMNEDLCPELRAAINQLLTNLWLDRHPHEYNAGRYSFPNVVWEFDDVVEEVPRINAKNALPDFQLQDLRKVEEDEAMRIDTTGKALSVKNIELVLSDQDVRTDFNDFKDDKKFKPLQHYIHDVLKVMKKQEIHDPEKNELTLSMINMLKILLSFGFYGDAAAISELTGPLVEILDGRDDTEEADFEGKIYAGLTLSQRFTIDEKTIKVMECKRAVCLMLEEVRKLTTNYRLRKYLFWFFRKHLKDWGLQYAKKNSKNLDKKEIVQLLNDLYGISTHGEEKYLSYSAKDYDLAFCALFEDTDDSAELDIDALSKSADEDHHLANIPSMINFKNMADAGIKLHGVLMDLMMYQNDSLFQAAFNLLFNLYAEHFTLREAFWDVEFATGSNFDTTYSSFAILEYEMKSLRELVDSHKTWLFRKEGRLLIKSKEGSVREFTATALAHEKCETIHELLANCEKFLLNAVTIEQINYDKDDDNTTEDTDAKEDNLEEDINEDVDQYYQNILLQMGIIDILISIVKIDKRADDLLDLGRWEKTKAIIDKALTVLTYMVTDHPENQKELHKNVHLFVDMLKRKTRETGEAKDERRVIYLLVELYNDNKELCNVEPPDELYKVMAELAFIRQSGLILKFFDNHIEPAKEAIIPRNQTYSFQVLVGNEPSAYWKTFCETVQKNKRFEQKLVRVLADCVRGNKPITKEMQTAIPWQKVLENIRTPLTKLINCLSAPNPDSDTGSPHGDTSAASRHKNKQDLPCDEIGAWTFFLDEVYLKSSIRDFSCINDPKLLKLMHDLWANIVDEKVLTIKGVPATLVLEDYEFRFQACDALRSFMKEDSIHDIPENLTNCLDLSSLCSLISKHLTQILDKYDQATKEKKLHVKKQLMHQCTFVSALMECIEDVYIAHKLNIEDWIQSDDIKNLSESLMELFPPNRPEASLKEKRLKVQELSSDLTNSAGDLLGKLYSLFDDEELISDEFLDRLRVASRTYEEWKKSCEGKGSLSSGEENLNADPKNFAKALDLQHGKFLRKLKNSGKIQLAIKEEQTELVKLLLRANEVTSNKDGKKDDDVKDSVEFGFKHIAYRMADYLSQNFMEEANKVTCTNIISVAQWTIDYLSPKRNEEDHSLLRPFKKDKKKVLPSLGKSHAKQPDDDIREVLSDAGFTGVLYNIICRVPSEELVKDATKLLRSLLETGAESVKAAVYNQASNHDKSGKFFKQVRNQIQASLDYLLREREGDVGTAESILTKHMVTCSSLFELLGFMCSRYLDMQNAFKVQRFNRTSIDLVAFGSEFLEKFVKSSANLEQLDSRELKLVISALEFIIACCQGPCPNNQLYVASSPSVLVCQLIITNSDWKEEGQEDGPKLKTKVQDAAIKVLAVCLEGRTDQVVHKILAQHLDDELLKSALSVALSVFTPDITKEQHDIAVNSGLNLMAVWQSVADARNQLYEKVPLGSDPLGKPDARNQLYEKVRLGSDPLGKPVNLHLCYVEVNWNGQIEPVWFPRPLQAHSLTDSSKQAFYASVDMSNRDTRLEGLLKESETLCDEMQVLYELDRYRLYRLMRDNVQSFHGLTFSTVVLLNFLIFLASKDEEKQTKSLYAERHHENEVFGYSMFLCAIILVCYSALAVFHVANKFIIIRKNIQRENKEKATETEISSLHVANKFKINCRNIQREDKEKATETEKSWFSWGKYILKNGALALLVYVLYICTLLVGVTVEYVRGWAVAGAVVLFLLVLKAMRGAPEVPSFFKLIYDLITTWVILKFALYIILIFLGMFHHQAFVTFVLLDVLSINEGLAIVTRSILIPLRKMLSILILFIISIVIFTSVGFLGFGDDQFCEDCDDELFCENLWNCFFIFFNTGIRSGGDLADIVYETFVSSDSLFYEQIFFLVGFYIVVGVLLFNMVTGLILDTFSSEREGETARKEKLDNEAFISGLQRTYCNEKGISFKLLNETDQSVWNYLFYILYLRIKDHQEYSGVENYVVKRFSENDPSWFPHFTSFSLERAQAVKADDESVQAKLESLTKMAERQNNNMEELKQILADNGISSIASNK